MCFSITATHLPEYNGGGAGGGGTDMSPAKFFAPS